MFSRLWQTHNKELTSILIETTLPQAALTLKVEVAEQRVQDGRLHLADKGAESMQACLELLEHASIDAAETQVGPTVLRRFEPRFGLVFLG